VARPETSDVASSRSACGAPSGHHGRRRGLGVRPVSRAAGRQGRPDGQREADVPGRRPWRARS